MYLLEIQILDGKIFWKLFIPYFHQICDCALKEINLLHKRNVQVLPAKETRK